MNNNIQKKQIKYVGKRAVSLILALLMVFQLLNYSGVTFYATENTTAAPEKKDAETQEEKNGVVEEEVTYEDLTVSANYTLEADLDVMNLTIKSGKFDLNGFQLNIHGNLTVSGGELIVNKGYVNCLGDTVFSGYNYLRMLNVNDYIFVKGDFIWNYGNHTYITDGIIEVQGDFIDNCSNNSYCFSASGNNRVLLSGNGKQTIVQTSPGSYFNILEIKNTGSEGVHAFTPVNAEEIIRNKSDITYPVSGRLGWTLQEDEEINGDFCLIGDELNLNGHTLTIHGNFIHFSGKVSVNGGTLIVDGDYRIQSYSYDENSQKVYDYSVGYLVMTNPEDTVSVNGDFVMASINSHMGKLSDGTMYIGGNFIQKSENSNLNFAATDNHKVVFNGRQAQSISFQDSYYNTSHFAKLAFENTSEEGITIADRVVVIGELTNESSNVTGYVDLNNGAVVTNSSYRGSLRFVRPYVLNQDIRITGDVYVSGNVDLKGNRLEVGGNSTINSSYIKMNGGTFICRGNLSIGGDTSYLYMTNENDSAVVYGDFIYSSRNSNSSFMTAGTLELKGDFQQTVTYREGNFIASGTNKVRFTGEKKQTISFASPKSKFNIVEISNYSSDGVVIDKNFNCTSLIKNNCRISLADGGVLGWTLEEDTVIDGDLYLGADELNLNGYSLTITGNLIQGGGTVTVNGGSLTVNGDYRIQSMTVGSDETVTYSGSTGYLVMTNPEDVVTVTGDFVMASINGHKGKLNCGTMYIGGDFTQTDIDSNQNFQATEEHKTVFNGDHAQSITFGKNSNSCFAKLVFANSSTEGILITDHVTVTGELTNRDSMVTGYVNLSNGASVTDNQYKGNLRFAGTYTLSEDLIISGDAAVESRVDLNGNRLEVKGDTTIKNTYLRLSGGSFICYGNLSISGDNGYLHMTNESDLAVVYGDFIYSSRNSNSSFMTAGTLELKGDFLQSVTYRENSFMASGTNKIIFSGDKKQTISFDSPKSAFNIVEIWNQSSAGVVIDGYFNCTKLIRNNCKVTLSDESVFGWTLEKDTVIDGDLYLGADELNLNGYSLTVKGNLIQGGGTVAVNGGNLTVSGDYRIQSMTTDSTGTAIYSDSTGYLVMTNPEDVISINGDFVMASVNGHNGNLTHGLMYIGGDFTQSDTGSNQNFCSAEEHKVIFNGVGAQSITFGKQSYSTSHFAKLEFANSSEEGITISDRVTVTGELTNENSMVTGYVDLSSTAIITNHHYKGNLRTYISALDGDLRISGDLYVAGRMNLNGNRLEVEGNTTIPNTYIKISGGSFICRGNLNISGDNSYLYMTNENDLAVVYGDFIYSSRNSNSGYMTAGTLELKGDFRQTVTYRENNFIASGTNKVIFSGDKKQTISFASSKSYFNIAEFKNYSEEGIYCENGLNALEIITNNCRIHYNGSQVLGWTLNSDTVIGEDLVLIGDTLDLNGHTLTVNGDFIQNSGTVYIHGGTLIVEGNYYLQSVSYQSDGTAVYDYSRGILKMTSDDDYVKVSGDFATSSLWSHTGMLTAGVFEVNGNFTQNNTSVSDNFYATEDFILKFAGNRQQVVSFASPENSKISGVVFDNSSAQGITISNAVYVTKQAEDNSRNVAGKLYVDSLTALQDNYFSGDVTLKNTVTPDSDITIGGIFTVGSQLLLNGFSLTADSVIVQNGTLNVDGGTVNCKKNFTIASTGTLIMNNETDYIVVGGDFTTASSYSHLGKLTGGVLEIKGDFTQNGVALAFACTDNHSVLLSGKSGTSGRVYKQTIRFSSAGSSAFQKLVITRPMEYYSFIPNIESICKELTEDIRDLEPPLKVEGLTVTDVAATTVSLTWNPSEDNIKVLGYEVYRNNEKIATVTGTEFTDSKLKPEQNYIYKICAFDEMRNTSEFSNPVSVTTAPDTLAPEIPRSLKVKYRTGSSIVLDWLPSSDNVGCTGYKIFRNGEEIATVQNETTYKDSGLLAGTEYIYQVKALDGAGNESDFCSPVSGYAVNPSITNISPADHTVIGSGSVTVTVRFLNTGNSVGNRVKFRYSSDGETWNDISRSLIGQQNYSGTELYASCSWDISKLRSGEYTVKCTLYDADDNFVEQEVTYSIDNDPPEPVSGIDADTDNGAVIIWWDVASDADCVSYHLYKSVGTSSEFKKIKSFSNIHTVSYTDKDIVEGQNYFYYVTGSDRFGHESEKSRIISIVAAADQVNPYIVSIGAASKINGEAEIKVTAYDNISVSHILLQYYNPEKEEWCDIGTEPAVNGVSGITWNTTGFGDGIYSVRAFAWDRSGNKSTEEFTSVLEIDNSGPAKIIISEGKATASGVSLKWQDAEEEDFAYFQVEQWKNGEFVKIGTESRILGMNITGLVPNTVYKFRVVGYDSLGNRGEASDEIEVTTTADEVKPYITGFSPAQSSFRDNIEFKITAKDNYAVSSLALYYSSDRENWTLLTTLTNETISREYIFEYTCSLEAFPEGILYFKASALDAAGNESEPVVASHKVDRTAPLAIGNLKAEDKNGYVSLSWTAADNDIKSFIIYRADEETGVYTELVHACTTKNYYDLNVDYGKIYSYKIKAVDLAGNISEESNETIVQVSGDMEAPVIYGMTPGDGSTVGENPKIRAVVYDAKLKSLYVEYKKADSDGLWTELGRKDGINGTYEKITFDWDTKGLEEGTYLLRAVAADSNNNTSEPFEISLVLDNTAPQKPVLSLLQENYQLKLEWNLTEEDDFDCYKIYRKSVLEHEYTIIHTGTDCTYTDKDITPGLVYAYKVEAYDKYGNYSESNVMSGYAYDEDTVAPTAVVPEEMIVVEGRQFTLDGTESTDNVRIRSFSWYMGNGETVYGSRTVYTYDKAGTYTAVLTVTDAAGNSGTAKFNITVLDKNTSACKELRVVNENQEPVSYAYVYLYSETEGNRTLRTDSEGMVTVSGTFGEQKIAVYKQGYLPKEHVIQIDSVGGGDIETVRLQSGEVVVGDFSVHRMELQEMVEAGIDFSNPANYESFTFTVELTFRQTPIPTVIEYIYTGNGSYVSGNGSGSGGSGGGSGGSGGISGGNSTYRHEGGSIQIEKIESEEELPLFAYINKTDSISWLKEMFCAELGIINCADPGFSLTGCSASIEIPEGLSLANTYDGQSLIQSMGTIGGQSSKSVSWYIKGDTAGEYNLKAGFSGTLMPFGAPINVTFETKEPFKVESGDGIHIYIQPESAAYIGRDYYIQYEVRNESNRIFYNFETTFGPYTSPGYEEEITITDTKGNVETQVYQGETYVIPEAGNCSSVPVISGGDTISVGVFAPGDVINGTFRIPFVAAGNADEHYYRLVQSVAEEIGESNTGVKLHISPMPSHITKYNVKCVEVKSFWGDPVDMTTGAFTDSIHAMSLNSSPVLSFDLAYDSLHTASGECGYGWSHNFETRLAEENGVINLYLTPENHITFVAEDKVVRNVKGELVAKQIMINTAEQYTGARNFICISTGMEDYGLSRSENGNYTLILPDGEIWEFNSEGKLTKLVESNGKFVDITYGLNSMTITEPASGMSLTAHYNAQGLLTGVEDYTGRKTLFAYEDGCLVKATNPLGESIYYFYDENHRLVQEQNHEKVTFVINTYDEQGRVIRQDDADSETPLTYYEYEVEENGSTDTTATDRNGYTVVYHSDAFGHISKITDQNGNSVSYAYDKDGNRISETNGTGGTTLYFYDEKGDIVEIRDCNGSSTKMTFDKAGNLVKLTGPDGETNTYTYDVYNRLLTTSEHSGLKKSYTYDKAGNVLSEATEGLGVINYTYANGLQNGITDYNGNTTTTVYDDYGNVKQVTAADGSTTTYAYDLLGRKTSITDGTGGSIRYTYDCNGNVTSITDENGGTATFEYNDNNWLVKSTNKRGGTTVYEYDSEGRNIKTTNPDGTVTTTEYDGAGCALTTTDAEGNIYSYEYDAANRPVKEILPDGTTVSHVYYPNGKEKQTTYADGSVISYTYDKSWRLVKTEDHLGHVYQYKYDKGGNLIQTIDPLGNVTTNVYDGYGRMLSSTDANGNTTAFEYDANGNCIKKTDALGLVLEPAYDSANRMTAMTAKTEYGDYTVRYRYDALGRVTEYTDEEGHVFKTEYDHLGNITAVIDADGNVTERTEYDSAGNVTKVTDALDISGIYDYDVMGNVTKMTAYAGTDMEAVSTYAYDAIGRMLRAVDAENGESSYTYDNVGNIVSMTDPNGGTTTYQYDTMGRLTRRVNAVGSKHTYTYNAAGLLAEARNARNQTTAYQYDALGRITSVTDALGTISYTYDGNGNVLTVTDESGTITREYDALNRVTKYTDARGNTVTYGYDSLGNLMTLTYPGGEIIRYAYYPTGRLKMVTDWKNRVITYEYDSNGCLTKLSRPDGSVETYEYDAGGQLTKQTDINGERVVNSFTYAYDTAGNITSIESENVAGEQIAVSNVTMKYDAANRLIQYNGQTVKYDADGNMTYGPLDGKLAAFTYDCRNRLVSAGDTEYEYDAENNRIGVKTGISETTYVVENNSGSLSQILSATETLSAEQQEKTTLYVYGNGLLAQEDETGEYLLYHFNNIGSTSAVTDMDGTIVHAYTYGTYGELLSGDSKGIRFLYNGRYGVVTDENGLYYMRARYYNVDIRRFINQDVMEGSITDSPSLNMYAYCQGNPVKLTDPFGLSPLVTWSTLGHALLDLAGFIPIIGAIPDTANAIWYMCEGDHFSAVASFVSAIPGWGDIAGAVGKGAKGGSKVSKMVRYGSKIVGRIGNIALGSYQTGNIAVSLYDKHVVQGESWDWNSTVQLFSAALFTTTTVVSAKGLKGDVGEYRRVVGSKGGSKSINPNKIRYSQSSVNGSSDIIQSMKKNGWKGASIDVVEMPDGIYTTIDNTRVVSAREAGINVQANVHGYNDPLPSEYIERFTTKKGVPKTWGDAIELRVGKQKASFRNGNPYGKFDMETIN